MRLSYILGTIFLSFIFFIGAARAETNAYKVPLSDSLDKDAFIKAYQETAPPNYRLGNTGEARAMGEHLATLAPLGERDALLISAEKSGLVKSILLMHQGPILTGDKEQIFAVYSAILDALGYAHHPQREVKYEQSFRELGLDSQEAMASRFTREDIGRIYTFYKSYNPQKDVWLIFIEAIVEK